MSFSNFTLALTLHILLCLSIFHSKHFKTIITQEIQEESLGVSFCHKRLCWIRFSNRGEIYRWHKWHPQDLQVGFNFWPNSHHLFDIPSIIPRHCRRLRPAPSFPSYLPRTTQQNLSKMTSTISKISVHRLLCHSYLFHPFSSCDWKGLPLHCQEITSPSHPWPS